MDKTQTEEQAASPALSVSPEPQHHLCVLVHGLWGNPNHLSYVAKSLRERHPEPHLHLLITKLNAGHHTYDGIELGGERVMHEVEREVESLAQAGVHITRLSMVGYSLGGLIARYAIGLLYSGGWFKRMTPVNFTTFASPYLGARSPRSGLLGSVFNTVAPRTLSMSGRQLFVTDSFRGTGRPLLEILADRKSIFMRGLAAFRRRTLYANIVNDRTAPFYTTAISAVDPYCDLRAVQLHYLKGYEDVILDPARPVSAAEQALAPGRLQRLATNGRAIASRAPLAMLFGLLVPVALAVFLVNSGFQSVRSSRRIQLHEQGKAGIRIGSYRIPLLVEDVQTAVEEVLKDTRPRPAHADHPASASAASSASSTTATGEGAKHENVEGEEEEQAQSASGTSSPASVTSLASSGAATAVLSDGVTDFPTLALTPAQLRMVAALDAVGFHKYPVHIHKDSHSHAAIIVRMPKESFSEGAVVMRHWLENEFDL